MSATAKRMFYTRLIADWLITFPPLGERSWEYEILQFARIFEKLSRVSSLFALLFQIATGVLDIPDIEKLVEGMLRFFCIIFDILIDR